MKKALIGGGVVALLLVGGIYVAAQAGGEPSRQETPGQQVQTARVSIPVEGMTCSACAAGVKASLKRIEGVTDVEVDLAKRQTRIDYVAAKVKPEDLAAAINKLGYKAGRPEAQKKA